MKRYLPSLIASFGIVLFSLLILANGRKILAASVGYIVISEIENSGTDEFVELYNPTSSSIDLTGWSLKRKPSSGSPESNLVASISGTIPANGFFLMARSSTYDGDVVPDATYSASIGPSNTLLLYNNLETPGLIDKVGFGAASDYESSAAAEPQDNGSIERKACEGSTSESMGSTDSENGNAQDSDNNASDFVLKDVSDPQNSQSAIEISSCLSETASPSATPEESPSPTETPEAEPSPSETPVETIIPSPTVSPEPTGFPFPHRFSCQIHYVNLNLGFFSFRFPVLKCGLNL